MKVDVAPLGRRSRQTGRALLEVDALSVRYRSDHGPVSAVDDISFSVRRAEVLGLVGESGCGKSTVAAAILGLLPASADVDGSITLRRRAADRRRPGHGCASSAATGSPPSSRIR